MPSANLLPGTGSGSRQAGRPAAVLRGDYTFLTVPVPRGAHEVRLTMDRAVYRRGVTATFASLGAILLWLVIPGLLRRRSA
jgi:hypothetical protein